MKKAEGVFMYIRGSLKNDFVSVLEIPEDLAYQEMIVTMTGTNHVMVENYRSIQKLTPEEIVILGRHGKVQIIGKRMEISIIHHKKCWLQDILRKFVGNGRCVYEIAIQISKRSFKNKNLRKTTRTFY